MGWLVTGTALLLLGAAWEIYDWIIQGWPTGLTWIMMAAGLLSLGIGIYRVVRYRHRDEKGDRDGNGDIQH